MGPIWVDWLRRTLDADYWGALSIVGTYQYLQPNHGRFWIRCRKSASGPSTQTMKLKYKILVVNDEPSIRRYLQTVLEADGCDVEIVSNGKDAISKVENGERLDLIILDLLMPEMNGLEALQELMRLDRSLNVIMVSCSTDFGVITEAIRLGARDYLVMPFEKVELEGAMLGVKQRKQGRLRPVERRVSRLSMKKQIQFWATSNL